jgi:hypothetical protein
VLFHWLMVSSPFFKDRAGDNQTMRCKYCRLDVATHPSKIRDDPCGTHSCVQPSPVMQEQHFHFRCFLLDHVAESERADFLAFQYRGWRSLLSP